MSKINPPSFIIIPYQLLADPRIKPIEEKLYGFIYWFSKLKNERCTAGNEALADLVKTTPGVIQNALTNLEKRGYIRRTYKDRNRRVRDEIMPLIDFASVGGAEAVAAQPEPEKPVRAVVKKAKAEPADDGMGNVMNGLLSLFEPVNPSFERLFSNKTQRAAMKRLIEKHGVEKMMNTIKYAVEVYEIEYAPSITTPLQLEAKLGQLIGYYKRENSKGPKMMTV